MFAATGSKRNQAQQDPGAKAQRRMQCHAGNVLAAPRPA
jgi:hypothetical protein